MANLARLIIACLLSLLTLVSAQPPLGGGVDNSQLNAVEPDSPEAIRRADIKCREFFREPDGACTNDNDRETKLWGSVGRPQFSYFVGREKNEVRGKGLRSPRDISNILSQQTVNRFDERRVSEIAVLFGQFIDHTLVATPLSGTHFNIPLRSEDSRARDRARLFGNDSALPFERSERVKVLIRDNLERPVNSLSSAVDLTNVYGPSKSRRDFLRSGKDAKMRTSSDGRNLLPRNTGTFNNAPSLGPSFFIAGDHRANEHPVLTCLHTLFLREHNRIADEISQAFPKKGRQEQFEIAKKINEAQFQRIVFEEWFPAITGHSLPPYKGFKKDVDLTVSVSFSTAGFRVGHTMIGNEVRRKGPGNTLQESRSLLEMFFQVVDVLEAEGIEPFLRGAITSRAQKVDLFVTNALRNSLFEGIENEAPNFDLIALNIQRGRDHGVPSYNLLRRKFCCPKAVSFSDISSDINTRSRLQTAYTSAGRVEAWPGLVAEDHAPGSSFGRTLLALWKTEFSRLRDGDRFFFRNGLTWPEEVLKLPRVKRLMNDEKFGVFRQIILDNTKISNEDLPKRLFFVDDVNV